MGVAVKPASLASTAQSSASTYVPKVWQSRKRVSTKPQCRLCGTDSPTALCPKCDEAAKATIRQSISASNSATRSCPTCRGKGDVIVKLTVPHKDIYPYGKITYKEVEESRQCGTCHGRGWLNDSLPAGADVDIAAIDDVGMDRRLLNWRPMNAVGAIVGLPHYSGRAFATDGIMVAIRRPDGQVVLGHLDSFEVAAEPKAITGGRKSKLQKLMEEFA